MATLLLIIIYLSFISLGLPDSLLGASWPLMHVQFGVDVGFQGIFSICCVFGTVLSSLFASKIIKKFGSAKVTFASVLLTSLSLLATSFSNTIYVALIFSLPLGLGAGAIDSGLNNYVALHYNAKHMNWLHCFWGVGVTISPLIVAETMNQFGNWNMGFRIIAFIQMIIALILLVSLPLWSKVGKSRQAQNSDVCEKEEEQIQTSNIKALKIKGVPLAILAFFFYCSVEFILGSWGSTYLVEIYSLTPELGATILSIYYFGITFGRGVAGFVAMKLSYKKLILSGQAIMLIGIVLMFVPVLAVQSVAFFMIGFGCAPIFPSMIGLTPERFGSKNSQVIISLQMACAYVAGIITNPVFGVIGSNLSMGVLPIFLIVLGVGHVLSVKMTDKAISKQ